MRFYSRAWLYLFPWEGVNIIMDFSKNAFSPSPLENPLFGCENEFFWLNSNSFFWIELPRPAEKVWFWTKKKIPTGLAPLKKTLGGASPRENWKSEANRHSRFFAWGARPPKSHARARQLLRLSPHQNLRFGVEALLVIRRAEIPKKWENWSRLQRRLEDGCDQDWTCKRLSFWTSPKRGGPKGESFTSSAARVVKGKFSNPRSG